jgi:hypothetical protein
VNSYRVGFPEEVNQIMTERFRHCMPDHAPIWTGLGVAALVLRPFFRNEANAAELIYMSNGCPLYSSGTVV